MSEQTPQPRPEKTPEQIAEQVSRIANKLRDRAYPVQGTVKREGEKTELSVPVGKYTTTLSTKHGLLGRETSRTEIRPALNNNLNSSPVKVNKNVKGAEITITNADNRRNYQSRLHGDIEHPNGDKNPLNEEQIVHGAANILAGVRNEVAKREIEKNQAVNEISKN